MAMEAVDLAGAQGCLQALYRQASMHGAAILYERQMAKIPVAPRPQGRPRRLPG